MSSAPQEANGNPVERAERKERYGDMREWRDMELRTEKTFFGPFRHLEVVWS